MPHSPRGRCLQKGCLFVITALVSLFIFHPGRFSESWISVRGLSAGEVLQDLVQAKYPPSQPYMPRCAVQMEVLKEWQPNMQPNNNSQAGTWRPTGCRPQFDATIIIPYRDRPHHLDQFLKWMHPFLQAQNLSYTMLVIEQLQGKPFNRAELFNIGYLEAKKLDTQKNCFIFHDVDLLPLNGQNLYACSRSPTHLSAYIDTFRFNLPYWSLFGGAIATTGDIFQAVNGFSNQFSGWGGEDDDFWRNRLHAYGYSKITRYVSSIAMYRMLQHAKEVPSKERHQALKDGRFNVEEDGLNSVSYSVISTVEKQLYTHILVAI